MANFLTTHRSDTASAPCTTAIPGRAKVGRLHVGMRHALVGLALLVSACASTTQAPPTPDQAQCIVENVMPWLAANWGEPGDGRPNVSVLNESSLQLLVWTTAAKDGDMIYGASAANMVVLWDGLDLGSWSGQMIVVHELAHWIDFRLGRLSDHAAVYAIAKKWAVQEPLAPCGAQVGSL